MRIDGIRADGAYLVLLDGGLACVVRGGVSSPAVEHEEARPLGPWTETDSSLPARRAMTEHLKRTRTVPLQSLRQQLELAAPATPDEELPFGGKKAAPFTKESGGGTSKADQKKKPFGGKKAPPFTKEDAVHASTLLLGENPFAETEEAPEEEAVAEEDSVDLEALRDDADEMAEEALRMSEEAESAEEHRAAADALEAAAGAQEAIVKLMAPVVPEMGTPEFDAYVNQEVARRVMEAQAALGMTPAVAPMAPVAPGAAPLPPNILPS